MDNSAIAFRLIFQNLTEFGQLVKPRGLLVREVENYSYLLAPYVRFCNFANRKLNLNYIKREFLWYLTGNKFDQSILDHASMWKSLVNTDGSINSNYGQYWFGSDYTSSKHSHQLGYVVQTLIDDKDSRRASMMVLQPKHLLMETNDYPCTYTLNFRIRCDHLNMSVHMRSQDAIFGMGNDAPCFSFVHEMVYMLLADQYPGLQLGSYHHIADSFHVYERHFAMVNQIVKGDEYIPVDCPRISSSVEARRLLMLHVNPLTTTERERYPFAAWLTTLEKDNT